MATRVEERSTMSESVSQEVSYLCGLARTGCQCAVHFVAPAVGDAPDGAGCPGAGDETSLGADVVDTLVRRLWIDVGVVRGRALLGTERFGAHGPRRLASPAGYRYGLPGCIGHCTRAAPRGVRPGDEGFRLRRARALLAHRPSPRPLRHGTPGAAQPADPAGWPHVHGPGPGLEPNGERIEPRRPLVAGRSL
jgi:hypothetical protein